MNFLYENANVENLNRYCAHSSATRSSEYITGDFHIRCAQANYRGCIPNAARHDRTLNAIISMKTRFIPSLAFVVIFCSPAPALSECDGCVVNAVQSASSAIVNTVHTGIASVLKLLNEIDTNLSSAGSKSSAIETKLGYCSTSKWPDGDADAASLFTGAARRINPQT